MSDLGAVEHHRPAHLGAPAPTPGHDAADAGEFTFGDFLDIINPLQHIPIVSSLYREITGDEISPHARILGDTLFGGPMGFLSAVANVFYEEVAGEDVGETVIALFTGEEAEGDPQFAGAGGLVTPAAAGAAALPAPLESAAGPAPAPAEAILPEAAPGLLTGQDALNALFRDLRGGAATPRPAPDTPAPAPRPRDAAAAADAAGVAAHPLLFAQEAGEGAIADRMMQALDKYRAMAQQNQRARDDERRADEARQDPVAWQSDPVVGDGSHPAR